MHALEPLFRPKAVAIVGASGNPDKVTGRPLSNLLRHGFAGAIYPVNPKLTNIGEIKCWPSVSAIPARIDVAYVALPAAEVLDAIDACAKRGAKAAVIYSSGFAEAGPEGARRQMDLLALARKLGIRIAGPNCLGIINAKDRVMLTASSAPAEWPLPAGHIGLVSQSGALCSACLSRGADRGIAFRYAVASGNEADIDLAEYLRWMLQDPEVRVLAAVIEGLKQPRSFVALCREAAERKVPVVVCRLGRSNTGRRAAASHTGSMLGDERAFRAVAERLGVVLVPDLDALVETAQLLSRSGRTVENAGVAVVSHSGGGAILVTDLLEESGVTLAPFAPQTKESLSSLLPDWGTAQNPLDLTTASLRDASVFRGALSAVANDPGVGAMVVVLSNTAARSTAQQAVIEATYREFDKPMAVYTVDGVARKHLQPLRERGVPVFDSASALAQAIRGALSRARTSAMTDVASPMQIPHDLLRRLSLPASALTEPESKALLAAAGIAVPAGRVAQDEMEAVAAADEIGYPVAVKLVASGVNHKSDVGGVVLGVADRDAVIAAFRTVTQRARDSLRESNVRGVLIERMVSAVAELIVGVRNSPEFGPIVMVGMGGIYTEVLRDFAIRPAPLSHDDAADMLRELQGYRLLSGFRGRPAADVSAAADAISRLSVLAVNLGDSLGEMEINPLGVGASGAGAWALDAVVLNRFETRSDKRLETGKQH